LTIILLPRKGINFDSLEDIPAASPHKPPQAENAKYLPAYHHQTPQIRSLTFLGSPLFSRFMIDFYEQSNNPCLPYNRYAWEFFLSLSFFYSLLIIENLVLGIYDGWEE